MPFLPSIQKEDKVPHVFAKFLNGTQLPLLDFHQALLRGESEFTIEQRELMAAYISGVNSCRYCYGAHSEVAMQFGIAENLLTELLENIDNADIDDKLRPVFKYLKKLTQSPTKMSQDDADAILNAGWSEQAFYDAVNICCLYNFMNRFVEGLGLSPIPEQFAFEGKMIADGGYNSMADAFGIK